MNMPDQRQTTSYNRRAFLKMGTCAGFGFFLAETQLACHHKSPGTQEVSLADEYTMTAYCCIKCNECDAYRATINDDDELRATVAEQWGMKPEEINCLGCKTVDAPFNCSAKQCAQEKNVITCAHCEDFPDCDNETWTKWPQLREHAEGVWQELNA